MITAIIYCNSNNNSCPKEEVLVSRRLHQDISSQEIFILSGIFQDSHESQVSFITGHCSLQKIWAKCDHFLGFTIKKTIN